MECVGVPKLGLDLSIQNRVMFLKVLCGFYLRDAKSEGPGKWEPLFITWTVKEVISATYICM